MVASTDGDFPWVCPFPEYGRIEKEANGLIFSWIFEGFWPGVHDIVDLEELVLDICNGKSGF
jgi:hypothetical protein